ncbi:DUF885 domain-containing protein [Micromonospora sp. AMSO1212t]|uniref:DUF885 family protein n=1 Tax=Micromonospora sp. AMSO1212t TaxID=2650565 RepID=UPI00124B85B8|nr:DUF885 family protein [Micromonospora sp. AMSO1212t]KAB1910411.1 DUF885 domain-containing protein [Micromonospora sp. AMSO1212t]
MDTTSSPALAELAAEFWAWRTRTQPDSYDDITRVERPLDWVADWSSAAVRARREAGAGFADRYRRIDVPPTDVRAQVDRRLLGSALARVRWELDLVRAWQRDPSFYIDQSLVCVYNLLLRPPPFGVERVDAIVRHLRNVPAVLEQARENLTGTIAGPFARRALTVLRRADDLLRSALAALAAEVPDRRWPDATAGAARAVAGYRDWLARQAPFDTDDVSVGADAFAFFLHQVALLPYSAEQVRGMARQEWNRAVWTETLPRRTAAAGGELPDLAELIGRQRAAERALRRFHTEHGLLSPLTGRRRYRMAPMPAYLEPLTWLGVAHDPASPSRSDDDAVRYVRPPSPRLPYFDLAEIRDPLTGLAHEGVHAHQLALSWRHDNPARRRYYDSAPNEGIAFYHEELMLSLGAFDDGSPGADFVVNAKRLRALRADIDVALALGDLTPQAAEEVLAEAVPMDRATAEQEAAFFAGNPGQGLSYQVGKLQVLDLVATCARRHGAAFDLKAFHDRLWREGNVPLALQRWELLGLRDHLDRADLLAGSSSCGAEPSAPPRR